MHFKIVLDSGVYVPFQLCTSLHHSLENGGGEQIMGCAHTLSSKDRLDTQSRVGRVSHKRMITKKRIPDMGEVSICKMGEENWLNTEKLL